MPLLQDAFKRYSEKDLETTKEVLESMHKVFEDAIGFQTEYICLGSVISVLKSFHKHLVTK